MNQFQLILYEIEDPSESRISSIEETVFRLSGGSRAIISARLQNLPAVIGDRLTAEQVGAWQEALAGSGVRMEVNPPLPVPGKESSAKSSSGAGKPGGAATELRFDLGDLADMKKQVTKADATSDSAPTPKAESAAAPGPKQTKRPAGKETGATLSPGAQGGVSRAPSTSIRRPVASATVTATRKDNKVIKSSGSFPISKPAPKDEPPPEQTAAAPVRAPSNEKKVSLSATASVPVVEVQAKKSPIVLVGLIVGFLVLPIFFFLLPDRSTPTTTIDATSVSKLLQQQQLLLDSINSGVPDATPVPVREANVVQEWVLHRELEKEDIVLDVETDNHGLRSAKLQLRGRKFWPLMQYDPKLPDASVIFVREITAEASADDPTAVLRGKGEALITSGTSPYRVELDVAITSRIGGGKNSVTFEFTDSKYGGLQQGGIGVAHVSAGEFRLATKRTFEMRLAGDELQDEGQQGTPTPVSKGSYQRIPMEVPKVLETPDPRGRRGR